MSNIINEILVYMKKCGGKYSDWYVGIAADPEDRLFNGHGVKNDVDQWIYAPCENSVMAREIEAYFLEKIGTAGGPGGGDYSTKYVYAYKIAHHTVESA